MIEEKVHNDIKIKEMSDITEDYLRLRFNGIVPIFIENNNIRIYLYRRSHGLFNFKSSLTRMAVFKCWLGNEKPSVVVYEGGRNYYFLIKEIAEKVGYETIFKKWRD